jgi:hypothetical protein
LEGDNLLPFRNLKSHIRYPGHAITMKKTGKRERSGGFVSK